MRAIKLTFSAYYRSSKLFNNIAGFQEGLYLSPGDYTLHRERLSRFPVLLFVATQELLPVESGNREAADSTVQNGTVSAGIRSSLRPIVASRERKLERFNALGNTSKSHDISKRTLPKVIIRNKRIPFNNNAGMVHR